MDNISVLSLKRLDPLQFCISESLRFLESIPNYNGVGYSLALNLSVDD